MSDYLYGLTVQGIQSYIFSTNKLKEIIGASEIIEQLCTTWFYKFLDDDEKEKGIYHLNAAGNIRFQTNKKTAKKIFKDYHFELLNKAPGVPFSQAVVKIKANKEYEAIKELDAKLRGQRNVPLYETDLGIMMRRIYRPTGSFACLENIEVKEENKFVDVVTSAKYNQSDKKILTEKVKIEGYDLNYPSEFKAIAKDSKHSWLAVIHIDGNGMGIIIKTILEDKDSKDKFTDLKEFSTKVGKCTIEAFKTAISEVVINKGEKDKEDDKKITLPIRPIIIGGDDVTVIIRADLALEFTRVYLETFETETEKLNDNKGITACAGIAYVKEKFPFHYSVNLAEELCSFAKKESNRDASSIQFHKVQDSIIEKYKEIVQRELTAKNIKFQNGPYYLDKYKGIEIKGKFITQTISKLTNEIKELKNEDSPKNGMREWIDAKFNNPVMASTLMDRLKNKTTNKYLSILEKEKAFMDFHTLLAVNTKTN